MPKASAQKGEERASRKPLSRQMRTYQHIAVGFVVVTFLLLLGVLYLSVSRATIRITPVAKTIDAHSTITIVPDDPAQGEIVGIARATTVEKSKVFTLPAEGAKQVEDKASGYVTLTNKSAASQPLVATTRLLSESGVLFRIQNYVIVPAGGEVQAFVKADQPGKDGEIAPSKFTIPGLPVSLQESIYGTSTDAMTGGVQYVRVLTDQDIANAEAELETDILIEGKGKLAQGVDRTIDDGEKVEVDVTSKSSNVAVGAEVGSFTVTMKGDVKAVWYPTKDLMALAGTDLTSQVLPGFRLANVDSEYEVNIGELNAEAATATVVVALQGVTVIDETAQALDKDRFVGRAPHEVLTLLRASESIQDVSLTFTPFWLKRVPTLKDHIKIIIEDPKPEK